MVDENWNISYSKKGDLKRNWKQSSQMPRQVAVRGKYEKKQIISIWLIVGRSKCGGAWLGKSDSGIFYTGMAEGWVAAAGAIRNYCYYKEFAWASSRLENFYSIHPHNIWLQYLFVLKYFYFITNTINILFNIPTFSFTNENIN